MLPCSSKSRFTFASSIDRVAAGFVVAVAFVGTVWAEGAGRARLAAIQTPPPTRTSATRNIFRANNLAFYVNEVATSFHKGP